MENRPNQKIKLAEIMSFLGEKDTPLFDIPKSRHDAFIRYMNQLMIQLNEKAKAQVERGEKSFSKEEGFQWLIEQFDERYNGFTTVELYTMIFLVAYEVAYRVGFNDGVNESKEIMLRDSIEAMKKNPKIIAESGGFNPQKQG